MEVLFHAVLAICGVLLTLRALVFVVQAFRDQRAKEIAKPPVTRANAAVSGNGYTVASDDSLGPSTATNDATTACEAAVVLPGRWRGFNFLRPLRCMPVVSRLGLTTKMMIVLTATLGFVGLLTVTVVYVALSAALRRHAIERAEVMATSVADNLHSVVDLGKKDRSALGTRLREYTMQKGVAYVVVEDPQGKLLARSFNNPGAVIRRESPGSFDSAAKWNTVTVGNRKVYEVTASSLDEQVGAVRLGVWQSEIDAEIFSMLTSLIRLILYATGAAILLGVFLVWRIGRPIRKLIRAAKSLGTGDLNAPSLDVEDATECGELSRALERLRSSVKAAMSRLGQES